MNDNDRKTASPKTDDDYEELVNRLDKVASMNEYTGSAVTPLHEYKSAEQIKEIERVRNESRKRQNK